MHSLIIRRGIQAGLLSVNLISGLIKSMNIFAIVSLA